MKRYVFYIVGLLSMAVILNGCAVGMALYGKEEPSMDELEIGSPMDRVHWIMRDYTPQVTMVDNKRYEVYEVQIGNAPSAGRALGHLAMDVLTWGAWEIVGTPIEGFSSKKMKLTIEYQKSEFDEWIVTDIKSVSKGGV